MLNFGAVGISWGNMILQLIIFLIIFALPIILAIYFYIQYAKRKAKIFELEQRVKILENELRKNNFHS
jgi:uncharacterized membrane protein